MSTIESSKIISVNLHDYIPYSTHFKWHEALLLRSFNMYVYPTEEVYANIIKTTSKLEAIRNRFGKPVNITSFYRPEIFNNSVNGAKDSPHIEGLACDFNILTMSCDEVRKELESELFRLGIRMERLPKGSLWVHIDCRKPSDESLRYFTP